MHEYSKGSEAALIVLHEIYGLNRHIQEVCKKYSDDGYDVYCPNLLRLEKPFDESQQEEAYDYFAKNIGLDVFQEVNELIKRLRPDYKKIVLLGYSVGATIAWRCIENGLCDAMIGCYGSRIRDYMSITPKIPALLVFADGEKSFDPKETVRLLGEKENVSVHLLKATHGFCNPYCAEYNLESAKKADRLIQGYLAKLKD